MGEVFGAGEAFHVLKNWFLLSRALDSSYLLVSNTTLL